MANIKDILDRNPILSNKDWTEQFHAYVTSVAANRIGLEFGHIDDITIPAERWAHAQLKVKTGTLAGAVMHINSTDAFSGGEYFIEVNPGAYDLNSLQLPYYEDVNGDTVLRKGEGVFFEWDYNKFPQEWWDAGQDIVRACFSGKVAGDKTLPINLTHKFHQCRLINQELPVGCTAEAGDKTNLCNHHIIQTNYQEPFIVEKGTDYTVPVRPLGEKFFDYYGISKDPADIPLAPLSKSVILLAEEAMKDAIEKNLATYTISGLVGKTFVNDKYVANGGGK